MPDAASAPSASKPRPVCDSTQSSISALPGPVSKASTSSIPTTQPRHIGDAADIEHRQRPFQRSRPTPGDTAAPAARPDRRPPRRRCGNRTPRGMPVSLRQQRPSPICHVRPWSGRMEDRMAMEADQIDAAQASRRQPSHRIGVQLGQFVVSNFRSHRNLAARGRRPQLRSRNASPDRGSSDERRFQQRSRRRCVINAASIPSSDVPLIRPEGGPQGRGLMASPPLLVGSTTGRLFPTAPRNAASPAGSIRPFMLTDAALTKPCIKPWNSVMSDLRSEFLRTLAARGFIHQCTDVEGLDKLAAEGIVTAYIGYDCTAPTACMSASGSDHDAAPAAADRPQADRR